MKFYISASETKFSRKQKMLQCLNNSNGHTKIINDRALIKNLCRILKEKQKTKTSVRGTTDCNS